MKLSTIILHLLILSITSAHYSSAQNCTTETFSSNKAYALCSTLPYLDATLHWSYHPSNGTVDIAYRAAQNKLGWVGWAINEGNDSMQGSNAFLAFFNSNSSLVVITTQLTSYSPTIQDERLDFAVYDKGAEFSAQAFTIYATLSLPSNRTTQYVLWQSSTTFSNDLPNGHPAADNWKSRRSLNFLSGDVVEIPGAESRQRLKNLHGVLNALSWGTLLLIGVLIARYLKVFESADPAWFYLHIACQCTAYILGISGWGIGLKLGSESVGIVYHKHRIIGITLVCLATLQLFALFLRPKPNHQYRFHWNLYHWSIGYIVIVLSVVNIFKGFDILLPAKKWKTAYIVVICCLAAIALVLEVFKWTRACKRKSTNHELGTNGHHDEKHQGVVV